MTRGSRAIIVTREPASPAADESKSTSHTASRGGLARLVSWSVVGRAAAAAYAWAVLIVISKNGDGQTAQLRVGEFVFALAVTSPLVPVARMELRRLLAADGAKSADLPAFARLRGLAGLALVAVAVAIAPFVADDPAAAWVIVALALLRAVEGGLDLVHGLYERSDHHRLVARSELLRALVGVGVVAFVLPLSGSLSLALLGVAAAWLVLLLVLDLPTARALGRDGTSLRDDGDEPPSPSLPAAASGLAWYAAPLGITAFLITLNTSLPRYFVEAEAGTAELAIFGAVAYLMAAFTIINSATLAALLPRFGRHLAVKNVHAARREMLLGMGAALIPGLVVVVVGAVWGDALLALIYRDEFAGHTELLIWIAVSHICSSVAGIPRAMLTAAGRLGAQPLVLIATLAVNVVACMIWVPAAPLLGGAKALLASRLVLLALNLGLALWALAGVPSRAR